MYPLTHQHRARYAHQNFTAATDENIKATTTTRRSICLLLYRLYKANERSIWVQAIFSNAAVLVSYLNPYFQQLFLEYIEQQKRGEDNSAPQTTIRVAYGYVLMMLLAAVGKMFLTSIQLFVGRRWNIRTLCMLDAEIYAKSLRRKDTYATSEAIKKSDQVEDDETTDKHEHNNEKKDNDDGGDDTDNANDGIGKITNLMSLDADHIADLPAYIFVSLYTYIIILGAIE